MARRQGDAFRRGFLRGLASPYTVFDPPRSSYQSSAPADLVAAAWQDVGDALREAMGIKVQRHGEDFQEASDSR